MARRDDCRYNVYGKPPAFFDTYEVGYTRAREVDFPNDCCDNCCCNDCKEGDCTCNREGLRQCCLDKRHHVTDGKCRVCQRYPWRPNIHYRFLPCNVERTPAFYERYHFNGMRWVEFIESRETYLECSDDRGFIESVDWETTTIQAWLRTQKDFGEDLMND